jgi:ubiquinone/menaquinone biosynthesis C-methylase UbiE
MSNRGPEPNWWRLFTDAVIVRPFAAGIYRRYADSLGLRGHELVLEIGQGSGALSRFLAPRCRQLLCVDLSQVWLDTARRNLRRFQNVEYMRGEVSQLPLANNSWDAVVVHFMLHDVDAAVREELVRTLARVLKPGGRFFLREPIRTAHGLAVEEIRRLLTGAGLREVSSEAGRVPRMGETWAAVFTKGG